MTDHIVTYPDGAFSRVRADLAPDGNPRAIIIYISGMGDALEHHQDAVNDAVKGIGAALAAHPDATGDRTRTQNDLYSYEWSGQGYSGRNLPGKEGMDKVYVRTFQSHNDDLKEFLGSDLIKEARARADQLGVPFIILGHSQGGHMVDLVTTEDPKIEALFDDIILVNPMDSIKYGNGALARFGGYMAAHALVFARQGKRYVPDRSESPVQNLENRIKKLDGQAAALEKQIARDERRFQLKFWRRKWDQTANRAEVARFRSIAARNRALLKVYQEHPDTVMRPTIGWYSAANKSIRRLWDSTVDRIQRGAPFTTPRTYVIVKNDNRVPYDQMEAKARLSHVPEHRILTLENAGHDPSLASDADRTRTYQFVRGIIDDAIARKKQQGRANLVALRLPIPMRL